MGLISNGNQVALVDTTSHLVAGYVDVGGAGCNYPWRASMTPDGSAVFVSCFNSGNVVVIDTETNVVAHVIGAIPSADGIAFTRDGQYAVVGSRHENQLKIVDISSYAVINTIYTPGSTRSVVRVAEASGRPR